MASAPVPVTWCLTPAPRGTQPGAGAPLYSRCTLYGAKYLAQRSNRSYFNLDFIYDQIPNVLLPFDYDAFAAFPGEVVAVVTNMETGKPEYLPLPRKDRRSTLLRATCALPFLFPPISYGGKRIWMAVLPIRSRGPCPGGRLR